MTVSLRGPITPQFGAHPHVWCEVVEFRIETNPKMLRRSVFPTSIFGLATPAKQNLWHIHRQEAHICRKRDNPPRIALRSPTEGAVRVDGSIGHRRACSSVLGTLVGAMAVCRLKDQ